jgi:small subunit ribosomal protein S17
MAETQNQSPEEQMERNDRKTRTGVVVSDKADKTVTVQVSRRFAHPLYGKQVAKTKKYQAHDEENQFIIGDTVRIVETRPLSKTKRWRVVELIERPE